MLASGAILTLVVGAFSIGGLDLTSPSNPGSPRANQAAGPPAAPGGAAAALLTSGKDVAPATGKARPVAGTKIAGSYVVVLKDRPDLRGERRITRAAHQLADQSGGRLQSVYTAALHGFSVKMSAAEAKALAKNGDVASVSQDMVVTTTGTQVSPSWSLDRSDQAGLPLSGTYDYGTDASNVSIYMMDTGVRATHSEFGGRVKNGPPQTDNNDCAGHGTATAGAAAGSTWGLAKGATIYAVRVLGCDGAGPATDGIAAIDWITKNAVRPAVVNASWGTGANDTLDTAFRNSIATGINYVIAAGNSNNDACGGSPARVKEAIVVGASDSNDNRAGFSSYGSCLDLFAPGTDVKTSAWDSDTATTSASGTSLAAPIVAGAVALYLSTHPTATPAQVSDALRDCASTGIIGNLGAGSPDRLLNAQCGSSLTLTNPGRQRSSSGTTVRLAKINASGGTSALRYSATGLPSGLAIDATTGVISGKPAVGATATVTVTATDGKNTVSTSFLWDVIIGYGNIVGISGQCVDNNSNRLDENNPIQLWECNHSWTARSDGQIEFSTGTGKCLTASDTAGDGGLLVLLNTCTGAASQIWAAQSNGELRNPATGKCFSVPRAGWGTRVTLAACDASAGQQWTLPSGATPYVVTVHNPGSQSVLKESDVWLKILGQSGNTTQSVAYAATGLPAGLAINTATGMITGKATTTGTSSVTVTATDSAGISASAAFLWQVGDGAITGLNGVCADVGGEKVGNDSTAMMFQCNSSAPQRWSIRSDGGLEVLGKCMTVTSGAAAGSLIPMTDCSGAASQVWQAQSNGALKNPASGRCLNAPSSTYRVQFTLETCNGSGNEVWNLPTAPATLLNPGAQGFWLTGAVTLATAANSATRTYGASGLPAGVSIDTATGKITGKPTTLGAGTAVVTAVEGVGVRSATAFTWTVVHGPITGPGNNCVDDYKGGIDNNSTIVVWPCNTGGTQLWTVGAKDTLEIQHKCLTVAGDATAAGSLIVLYDCRGVDSQVWRQQADGTLLNPVSGRCLNAPALAAQTQFTLADCTAAASSQLWRLPTTPAAPVITAPGNQRTVVGTPVSLQLEATSDATSALVFKATGLPAGLAIDEATGVVSGTATKTGTSSVTVSVTAGPVSASTSFTWEVFEVPPAIVAPGNQRTALGTSSSLQIRATTSGSAAIVFKATGLPAGLSIDATTGLVSGKATATGTSSVTVSATAGTATASTSFTWEVYEGRPVGVIQHSSGSWCIDSNDNAPWLWDCNKSGPQTWTVRVDNRLQIASTMCMATADAATSTGTQIVLSTCSDDDGSQVWRQQDDGTLLNLASGLCLTVDSISYTSRFHLTTCSNALTQQFKLPSLA